MGSICVVAQALSNDCCGKTVQSCFRPVLAAERANTAADFGARHKYKYSVQLRGRRLIVLEKEDSLSSSRQIMKP